MGPTKKQSKEKKKLPLCRNLVQTRSTTREHTATSIARLVSKKCTLLSAYLDQESVDKFLGLVTDYDSIVGSVGLTGDFSKFKKTDYNVEKISDLWTKQKGDFVGTNCRINSLYLEESHRDS